MKPSDEPDHFFDKPANVQKVLRVFYAICALLFLADIVVHRHVEHPLEEIPTFYASFGFIACVVLVLVATQMRKLLMRGENYYGDDDG